MWLPNKTDTPRSSFLAPATPPGVEPDAEPRLWLHVNTDWLPLLAGAALQLLPAWAWDTTDPTALATVQGQARVLLGLITQGETPVDPDATTTTTGDVLVAVAPTGAHPIALVTEQLGAVNGVAPLSVFAWVEAAYGGLGLDGTTGNKGAIAANTGGAWALRDAGADGTVLTSDSGQPDGVQFAALPSATTSSAGVVKLAALANTDPPKVVTDQMVGSIDGVASLNGSGRVPLVQLDGITTAQLDGAAGIVAGQIASVDPSALTGSGTVPVAGLPVATNAASGVVRTHANQLGAIPSVLTVVDFDVASGVAQLDSGAHVPLARLSGITSTQLSASAGIAGSQLVSTAGIVAGQITSVDPAALTGSGTVPLAGLAGITHSQLDAAAAITGSQLSSIAGIVAGQITSVNPSALTGSGTVPAAGLPDATTTTLGALVLRTAKSGTHPVALTSDDLAAASGVADLDAGSHVPLSRLSGLTTSQLSGSAAITGGQLAAAAGIVAAQITSVNPSALTGSGTVPVAGLPVFVASGASHAAGVVPAPSVTAGTTHYLREDATWATLPAGPANATTGVAGLVELRTASGATPPTALTDGDIGVASGVAGLDGSSHVLLTNLSGITTSQISASAAITGSQLSSSAGLVAAQITSVNPSALTGSGTVPVAGLPVFVASGGSHAAGAVPDPGSSAGTTRYLREDATWTTVSATVADATTTTTGVVEIRTAKSGTHPVALTTDDLNVASGVAPLDGSGLIPLGLLSGIGTVQMSATAGITGAQINSVRPSTLTGSGTVPLAALAGITTTQISASAGILHSQLDSAAGILAAQIASVNPSALTGSGTVPVAGLPLGTTGTAGAVRVDGTSITVSSGTISAHTSVSDATTSTVGGVLLRTVASGAHPIGLTTDDFGTVAGVPQLDSASHMTLSQLSGITHTQLSAFAAILGSQLSSSAAITGSQLDAAAGIVAGQITSVNPSALTGSGTVPVAGLSGITHTQIDAAAAITGSQLAAAAAIGSGQLSLTNLNNVLSGDVSITGANTFFNGAAVTLAAGTWLVVSTVSVLAGSTSAILSLKLWDGTTTYAHTQATPGSTTAYYHATLCAIVTPGSSLSHRIAVASSTASGTIKAAGNSNSPGNFASSIYAVRLG